MENGVVIYFRLKVTDRTVDLSDIGASCPIAIAIDSPTLDTSGWGPDDFRTQLGPYFADAEEHAQMHSVDVSTVFSRKKERGRFSWYGKDKSITCLDRKIRVKVTLGSATSIGERFWQVEHALNWLLLEDTGDSTI